ncbi:MAG: serine/threonine protein kinase, partial [Acidobacteriota bacterium]|nr:serine/threonine protein kinase [Acidobacteriota bacterium]
MISVGSQIGRYKVLNLLGVGGMGEVFLAEDIELGRLVALKFLPSEVSHDKERIRRFIQEAKAASALNHPNILTIHEIGSINGTRFIASEFVKGKTLRDKLKSESLNLSETIEIAIQITSALHTAHSSNIIHRDIKPENIMIREDNLVKVVDFGLAKLAVLKSQLFNSESPTYEQIETESGVILGTFSYMSPEQARGKTVDHRTDIFSLGIVLYEILTGRQPFIGETKSDVIAAILMNEPQNPRSLNSEIPAELERIILKTLCKERKGRYQTAKDLLEALK